MRIALIALLSSVPIVLWAQENLESKVVRLPLNQNQPAAIKVGSHGITTIEFPTKIEALDGFGFSVNPAPDGPDLFQISFNKGTNFLSLKAVRPGVEGNLTVVLDGKVYSLFCREATDPSFVVIFEDGASKSHDSPPDVMAKTKAASPARLMGFLDKVKGFPTLRNSAPEIFKNMDFAEPDSHSGLKGVDVVLRRVIRDDALDSVGFEIQLVNKSDADFLYDPEGFAVRVGDEVYAQSISDAGGMVPAGKTETAFFVVTGTATGGRNDLAVTNKFEIVMRQITGEMDPQRKASAEWEEPPNTIPTATSGWQEPALPNGDGEGNSPKVVKHKKGRAHSKGKKLAPSVQSQSQSQPNRDQNDKMVAQHDE